MKSIAIFLSAAVMLSLSGAIGLSKSNSSVRKEFERLESVSLPNTQVRRIYSEKTKHAYRFYVNLPASYYDDDVKNNYASIFVLDADYAFPLVKQISEHLLTSNIKALF